MYDYEEKSQALKTLSLRKIYHQRELDFKDIKAILETLWRKNPAVLVELRKNPLFLWLYEDFIQDSYCACGRVYVTAVYLSPDIDLDTVSLRTVLNGFADKLSMVTGLNMRSLIVQYQENVSLIIKDHHKKSTTLKLQYSFFRGELIGALTTKSYTFLARPWENKTLKNSRLMSSSKEKGETEGEKIAKEPFGCCHRKSLSERCPWKFPSDALARTVKLWDPNSILGQKAPEKDYLKKLRALKKRA